MLIVAFKTQTFYAEKKIADVLQERNGKTFIILHGIKLKSNFL